MKRILCILFILFLAVGAFAQSYDFTQFEQGFQDFADGVANSLPFNASIGQNWSDAYIGQFPHMGFGVTVGVTTIPFSSIQSFIAALGNLSIPEEMVPLETYGMPIPAYTVDLRMGGFGIPFDFGIKVGYIAPEWVQSLISGIDVNYLMVGGDVRFALLKDSGFVPALSVGAGYTFMKGSVGVPGMLIEGQTVDLSVPNTLGGTDPYTLTLSSPIVDFNWQSNVIDLKAQVSKKLLIFTFDLGLGGSYGISSAGGGVSSSLTISPTPTPEQQALIDEYLASQGAALGEQGFTVSSVANGWSFRAFGGIALNIFIVKLDIAAMYNFTSGSYGGSVNLRLQF